MNDYKIEISVITLAMLCHIMITKTLSFNNELAFKTMCNECCSELRGWCKSFTRTEALLTIIEIILLVICIAFLVFLILHLVSCSKSKTDEKFTTSSLAPKYTGTVAPVLGPGGKTTHTVECTWKVSQKTSAVTHYYEQGGSTTAITPKTIETTTTSTIELIEDVDSLAMDDQSDGEEADSLHATFVLALVKLKPPRDITFGCILTVVKEYWTLTAASCIEAIEEVDSLDSFVMMEAYGDVRQGRTHAVTDVQIHPQYQGANRSYDLAALKSESRLYRHNIVELPTMVDYFLITIGERFTLLGFGGYRSTSSVPWGRRLRSVLVYSVPRRQCPAARGAGGQAGSLWSPRHLERGAGAGAGAPGCGAGALCAGALYARGAPCNYCAGAPLLRGALLLGVMSDNKQCGLSCEPTLYVNIALVRDWLDTVVNDE